jgi:hypothetical protein
MDYYEEINSAENVLVTELLEPKENTLEFELTIGKVSDYPENIIIGDVNIGSGRSISFDGKCQRFKVVFENYIGYAVINESYETLGGECFSGNRIRIYSDSNFLNYIKLDTFATSDFPGTFKHFAFISQRHIINIASQNEPNINRLQ